MNAQTLQRQPHAALDLRSRDRKAMKIERLLGLPQRPQPVRMLEIGRGFSGIAYYPSPHPALCCRVTVVDIIDNRLMRDGHSYRQVEEIDLHSTMASLDVVMPIASSSTWVIPNAQHRRLV